MKNDIIEKLNNHLLLGINREADVVYLLVQIRKLLEDKKDRYPTLYLDCDWVLHTSIERNKYREQILEKINHAVAALENPNGSDHVSALSDINEAISQADLFRNMRSFLQENNLPLTLLDPDDWKHFIKLLMTVLQDVPLIASGNPLNLISQFSFAEGVDISHSFRVRIQLPDQRVYHGPVEMVGTNWAVGVVSPSAAAPESDLDQDGSN